MQTEYQFCQTFQAIKTIFHSAPQTQSRMTLLLQTVFLLVLSSTRMSLHPAKRHQTPPTRRSKTDATPLQAEISDQLLGPLTQIRLNLLDISILDATTCKPIPSLAQYHNRAVRDLHSIIFLPHHAPAEVITLQPRSTTTGTTTTKSPDPHWPWFPTTTFTPVPEPDQHNQQ